jgi:hypothetical protein
MRVTALTIAIFTIPILTASPAFASATLPRVAPVRVNVSVDLARGMASQNQNGGPQSSGGASAQGGNGSRGSNGGSADQNSSGGNNGGASAGNGGNGGDGENQGAGNGGNGGNSSNGGTVNSGGASTNSQTRNVINTVFVRITVGNPSP